MVSQTETRLNAFDVLYERRSTRTFVKGRQIPEDIAGKILDSARYAPPTPTGEYPWRMMVVKDDSTKQLIAACAEEVARTMFGGSYESFKEHLWYMPEDTRLRVAEYSITGELWRYPEDCDMLTIPCLLKSDWSCGLGGILRTPEQVAPYLGFASQNMWLTGAVYGVGAGYNAMPQVDVRRREIAASYLGVPHSWDPTGGFAFGYSPNVRISGPSRPPLEAVVFSEMWGVAYQRQAYSGGATAVQMPDRNIFDCMRNLNLVQTFKPGRVEPWMLERILDVGMWGPTPENFKQWRYIVVKDQASKEFLHKLTEERKYTPFYFSDTEWQHARTWYMDKEQRLARVDRVLKEGPSPWLRQADTLIIVATPPRAWVDSAYLPNVVALRNPISFIATGCCVQNMMLGATALGLGVNYDPTPVHDARNEETIREHFGIPSSWTPMGILCLGEPGERLERAPEPPVEALVFDDYWGNNHRGPKYSI